jgi:hypothetical protein
MEDSLTMGLKAQLKIIKSTLIRIQIIQILIIDYPKAI